MEKTEKLKITTATQFEKLVEELHKNPTLAMGFRRGTVPSNFKEQWETIGNSLNSLGPPMRSGDGWQKVWRDLKFKVKKKMVANKAECNATGGGIFKQYSFSPLEEAVANLLQFRKQLNPEGVVQGVSLTNVADLEETEVGIPEIVVPSDDKETPRAFVPSIEVNKDLTPISVPATVPPLTPTLDDNNVKRKSSSSQKKANAFSQGELLLQHSTEQAKLLTEISSSLGSIKRSLRDFEKRQKQLLGVEEKKLNC